MVYSIKGVGEPIKQFVSFAELLDAGSQFSGASAGTHSTPPPASARSTKVRNVP